MAENFRQTPAYQLNLILWLSWFSVSEKMTGIKPIFRDYGYSLHSVERKFSLAPEKRIAFSQATIEHNVNIEPDVLLKKDSGNSLLPIECKLSSFSTESSNTKQANALLSISGDEMARQIGLSSSSEWDSFVCYAVGDGLQELMHKTLVSLSQKITAAQITPNSSGAIGIEANESGIIVDLSHLNGEKESRIKVKSGGPHILYLLPADLDENSDEMSIEIRSLEERLRAAFVELIMGNINRREFSIDEKEVITKTIVLWSYWSKRQARQELIKRAIRPYLKRIVSQLKKIGVEIVYENTTIMFSGINGMIRQDIIKYLSSSDFKNGDIGLVRNIKQLRFSDIEGSEGWE